MNLELDEGCPGRRFAGTGPTWGLCLTCELQGRGGKQIEPAAVRVPGGAVDCPNWRSTPPTLMPVRFYAEGR